MSEVRAEVEEGVATLTLAAPERRNALTTAMAAELVAACDAVDADRSVGAVVVAGEGTVFCAGADRATLFGAGADPASEASYRDLGAVYRAFTRVGELEAPTVAAVRGTAVGAGVNLMLATDLRVVATDARIVAGFTALGIHPGGGYFTLAARAGGREAAAGVGLFGQELSGARAAEMGMAWEAVAAEEVEPRAREMALVAAADPELSRLAVRTMRLELGPPGVSWAVALEAERAAQMWSLRRRAGS